MTPVTTLSPDAAPFPEGAWSGLQPRLVALRRHLHRNPEVSGQEAATAEAIRACLVGFGIEPVAERVGGHGLLYRIDGRPPGPVTLLRADIDALPLTEASGAPHASASAGRHHACGHDGHSAMLAGALALLHRHRENLRGTVYGLFQPAEEVGSGMAACLADPALRDLRVDRAFAIHNLPGAPFGAIVLPRGAAAPASTGVRIRLEGARGHASEPHLARNPIHTLAELAQVVQQAPTRLPFRRAALATLTRLEAGGDAFGSSPDVGFLNAVLRADAQEDLDAMVAHVREQVERRAGATGLSSRVELVEPFPATRNDDAAFEDVSRAAGDAGAPLVVPEGGFPWSEDFGLATQRWPSALFGLGAGEAHPPLHSGAYDFPDDLLAHGARMWWALAMRRA